MTTSSRRESGGSRAATLAFLLAGGLAVAIAVAVWTSGDTNAPALAAPAENAIATGTATGATPTFEWQHGSGTPGNRNPERASDFVVCVLAAGQECAWTGTFPENDPRQPLHIWTSGAEAIPRSASPAPAGVLRVFDWFRPLNPRLDRPYHYRFTPPMAIPFAEFGQPLSWTAGACNDQSNARCQYAPPRAVQFALDVNLKVHSINDDTLGALNASATAVNTGGTDSGPFKVGIELTQLLLQQAQGFQPRKDIGNPDFTAATLVMLKNGHVVTRDEALELDPNEILGIVKPGGLNGSETFDVAGVPPGQAPSTFVGQIGLTVPPNARPARFAIHVILDLDRQLPELNELDNELTELSDLLP